MEMTGTAGRTGRNIAEQLRADILQGLLAPGERIGQEVLAERFDASRIPVREGLKILEAEGLITIVPNRGAWVARLDAFEFDQIYKLREQVESLVLRESIDGLTTPQIDRLQRLADDITKAPDAETFMRLDQDFHLSTYAGASFPLLHDLVHRCWNATVHYRRIFAQELQREQQWATDAEHHLIVDSIVRRDHETAGNLIRAHIRRTRLKLAARPDIFQRSPDPEG